MSFSLNYTDKFLDDLKKHKKTGQKQLLSKVERLVTECLEKSKNWNRKTGTTQTSKNRNLVS